MTRNLFRRRLLGWWLIPVLAVSWGGWAEGAEAESGAPATPPAEAEARAPEPAVSYWLGIMCAPVDALLKSHLKLDGGVVVERVVPDSPATKGGIRENDILLKFGEVKLTDAEGLMKAVKENKDREAKLSLLREGKETTLTVKPAPRPEGIAVPAVPGAGDWGQITDRLLKRLERGEGGEDPLSMLFVHPGVVVPKLPKNPYEWSTTSWVLRQMPKNTSITIKREQEGPAKILVQRGDEKWEINEKELDKLPEDLRPAVKAMLGGHAGVYVFGRGAMMMPGARTGGIADRLEPKAEPEKKPKGKPEGKQESAEPGLGKVGEQLDEMTRQLRENEQRMQRQLDELRQQLEKLKQQRI